MEQRPTDLVGDGTRPGQAGRPRSISAMAVTPPRGRAPAPNTRGKCSFRTALSCRTPSCTPTRRTASSTVPAPRRNSSRRPPGSGLRRIALTDHDGLYGVVRFAEAAAELDMRTVFGAELSLAAARTDVPDPPGPHLLVLARGPEGYRRLSRQIAAAHLAGGEKGKPRYDFDALTEAAGRALAHPHRMPQRPCAPGALDAAARTAADRALADLVDRFGRDRVSVELTHHGHPARRRAQRALAELAPRVRAVVCRHHRRALRRPDAAPAGDGDGGDPGPAVPGRGRRLAGPAGRCASAVGCGDGRAVRAFPGVVTAAAELGRAVRVRSAR